MEGIEQQTKFSVLFLLGGFVCLGSVSCAECCWCPFFIVLYPVLLVSILDCLVSSTSVACIYVLSILDCLVSSVACVHS